MIGTVGSIGANIYQSYRNMQLSQDTTPQALSFDDLLSNGIVTTNEEPTLGVESINALPSVEKSSDSSASTASSGNSNSDMDLNKDGQVTSDEVIRYIQIQMIDRISEEISSDEGLALMGQQTQLSNGIDEFKNKLAKAAYKIGDAMLDTATSSISYSFLL